MFGGTERVFALTGDGAVMMEIIELT